MKGLHANVKERYKLVAETVTDSIQTTLKDSIDSIGYSRQVCGITPYCTYAFIIVLD